MASIDRSYSRRTALVGGLRAIALGGISAITPARGLALTAHPAASPAVSFEDILGNADERPGQRVFWVELSTSNQTPIWIVKSAREQGALIRSGLRYADDTIVEVLDARSGATLATKRADIEAIPFRDAPVSDASTPAAPLRYGPNLDAKIIDFAPLQNMIASFGVPRDPPDVPTIFAALMPFGQYVRLFDSDGWLFEISARRMMVVLRRSHPHGYSYPRSGDYRSAVTTVLIDAASGDHLAFGIKGDPIPGSGPFGRRRVDPPR